LDDPISNIDIRVLAKQAKHPEQDTKPRMQQEWKERRRAERRGIVIIEHEKFGPRE
jgi:hypothetical protein